MGSTLQSELAKLKRKYSPDSLLGDSVPQAPEFVPQLQGADTDPTVTPSPPDLSKLGQAPQDPQAASPPPTASLQLPPQQESGGGGGLGGFLSRVKSGIDSGLNSQDDLSRAQLLDRLDSISTGVGRHMAHAASLMSGGNNFDAAGYQAVPQHVKDYLTKRQVAQEDAQNAQQKAQAAAMHDPNSAESKMFRGLAKRLGLTITDDTTAAQLSAAMPFLEKAFSSEQQGAFKTAELEAMKGKNTSELQQQKDKLAFEREKAEADREEKRREAEERERERRERERKEKAPKEIPEQEASKIGNMIEAVNSIDQLKAQHEKTRSAGGAAASLLPIGDTEANRYTDKVNALASSIAAGAAPAARENAQLMEEFKRSIPTKYTGGDRADAAFASLRDAVRRNARTQIDTLKAGGYSPEQIAALEKKLEKVGFGAAPAAPAAKAPAGKIAVTNGKETLFIDPADEADASKDGYRRQ